MLNYQRASIPSFFGIFGIPHAKDGGETMSDFISGNIGGIFRTRSSRLPGMDRILKFLQSGAQSSTWTHGHDTARGSSKSSISVWLVVWNICHFSIYWECHHPN